MSSHSVSGIPDVASADGVNEVVRTVASVRRGAWRILVAQEAGRLAGIFIAALVGAVVLDFFLRTPVWMRSGLWAGGLMLVGLACWRWIRPALGFRPSLTDVALRIEQSQPGIQAGLPGVLAAGLELGAANRDEPVVRGAVQRISGLRTESVLSKTGLKRVGAVLGAAVVASATLAVSFPTLAGIGVQRILTPWSGAQWPKRTEVADATSKTPHARGSGLLLRAVVLKNQGGLGADDTKSARVWGKYRVLLDGDAGPVRRVLLTGQDRLETVASTSAPGGEAAMSAREGSLFEYLVEPWGLTASSTGSAAASNAPISNELVELEYWFETEDDATAPHRVPLVEPPSVVSAIVEITAPAYVSTKVTRLPLSTTSTEGTGVPSLLAGSTIRVSIELNKVVPAPVVEGATMAERGTGLTRVFGDDAARALMMEGGRTSFEDRRWMVDWTLRETVRLRILVEDAHGIAGPEIAYSFGLLEDGPPAAAVTMPDEDRSALPDAVIELSGEGRDDVGLAWTAIGYRIARTPGDSQGAVPEAGGDEKELARIEGARAGADGVLPRELVARAVMELGSLGVQPGDEVWVTASSKDAFQFEGATHDAARSLPRKIRIISQDQLVEQIWGELSGVRRSAMATDEEQARQTRDAQRGGELSRLERAQADVSDRLSRDREALERIEKRMGESGLREETVEQVLREAKRLIDEAGKSSVEAAEKLRQAGEAAAEQPGGAAEQTKRGEAGREQDKVREELGRLIDLLDQGQDTWATKRAVERMLEQQRTLQQRTAKAGEQTIGKQPSQLTEPERAELERVAADQRALSQQAAEAIQQMMETEPKLRKNDPASADVMSQAAQQAQQSKLSERMQQASQQVQENQTNKAQQEQARAIEAMEQMLEAMQNSASNRDEVLRRKLASLIESIEALIEDQRGQLAALAAGVEKNTLTGLDRGMARLHQNTLGVLDEASQGPRELQAIADLVGEAAEAQANAVVALRVAPFNADEAKSQEEVSLAKLLEAKETADGADRDAANRQAQRKRAELTKAYREALSEQVAIRAETEPLTGVEPSRRTRATARTLGEREAVLQDLLAGIERDTKELSDAVMFTFAHRRLDRAVGAASKRLVEGIADRDVTRTQDGAIRVLNQILQSLDSASKQDEDEFRKQSQAQQGGGGQQGGQTPLVPPMAELKLLRSMQEEIGMLTREAEQVGSAAALGEAAALQGELATQGDSLLKKMAERRRGQQPAPTGPMPEPEPNVEPGEEKADEKRSGSQGV